MKKFRSEWMNKKPAGEHEWSTGYEEGLYLYNLAMKKRPDVIVETGTFRGYSGAYFLHALEDLGKGVLYTIDTFNYHKFSMEESISNHVVATTNLMEIGNRFTQLIEGNHNISILNIDILYVDGDHSYEGCYRDLIMHEPDVRENGCILIHDYHGARVRKATDDYFKNKNYSFYVVPGYKNTLLLLERG